ncbi:RCC1-like G exchanging factor-like protein [Argonauta hians]
MASTSWLCSYRACCHTVRAARLAPVAALPRRHASTWKKRVAKQQLVEETVYQYAADGREKLSERIYGWGFSATGALGIKSYLRPGSKQNHMSLMHRPARLRFFDEKFLQVHQVACGYGFTVFTSTLQGSSVVLGTGINTDSQLGCYQLQSNTDRYLDYIIQPTNIEIPLVQPTKTKMTGIAAGRAHTVILTDQEGVFSLGNNAFGQCGRPIIETEKYRGSSTISKIRHLPDNIKQVVCGQDNTFFLTDSGQVYSCGLSADGQTGVGHYRNVSQVSQVKGDIEGVNITQVACSGDCVLAVSAEGDLFGWGNSEYNQLAMITDHTQVHTPTHFKLPASVGKVREVASGGSICGFLNDSGEVFTWGFGILGRGPNVQSSTTPTKLPSPLFGTNELDPSKSVVSLKCGIYHFVALTNRNDIYTWGKNKLGFLGLGDRKDQFFPLRVSMPVEVIDVWCGVDHMIAQCRSFS